MFHIVYVVVVILYVSSSLMQLNIDQDLQCQDNTSGCIHKRVLHFGQAVGTVSFPSGSPASIQPGIC